MSDNRISQELIRAIEKTATREREEAARAFDLVCVRDPVTGRIVARPGRKIKVL
jgi:hypothetical protein